MDTPNNEALRNLVECVAKYCNSTDYLENGRRVRRDAVRGLVNTFHESLPELANVFGQYSHSPDVVYAKKLSSLQWLD